MHHGIGVIVSHDRSLLDAITSQTLRLSDAALQLYAGAYTQARQEWELDAEHRREARTIVASLGVDPDRLLLSEQPSPGEARKLLLALGFARQARALVLDEPENHLDLPSIERVEAALVEYPGALYLVTHDSQLARACTEQRWRLESGTLRVDGVEVVED